MVPRRTPATRRREKARPSIARWASRFSRLRFLRPSAGEDRGGGGAGSPVDLGVADPRITFDLTVAGLAAELEHEFVDLAEAGGPDRFAVGDEAAVGVDRHGSGDLGRAVGEKLLLVAVGTETVLRHVDDLGAGIGVLDLDHIAV